MTGDDWSALGVFWISRPDGKERGLACFPPPRRHGKWLGTCNLGICMEQGIGVEADPRQAFWLYQQAVEMGSLSAVCNLGVCYEQGIGTTSDQKKGGGAVPASGGARLPPGGRGCWPAVWNRGWDCPRTKRLPWNGCGPPPFRGTPPARRSWPGTMSLASGRRSPQAGRTVVPPCGSGRGCGRTVLSGLADGTRKMGGAGRGRRGPALFAGGGAGAQPGRSASGDLLPQWDRDAPGPRPGLGPAGPGMGAGGRVRGPASWDRCA